jgi:hypothetical protein
LALTPLVDTFECESGTVARVGLRRKAVATSTKLYPRATWWLRRLSPVRGDGFL